MRISILTLFPEMFSGPFDYSIIRRAIQKKCVSLHFIQIRDFAVDKHKSVDDHPYGGGQGMILRVDIIDRAIKHAIEISHIDRAKTHIVLLDPQGVPYTQQIAKKLSAIEHLIFICGHYEGVDERVRTLVDTELSIGDYVLTGGELPAMVIVDSVVRLLPTVLANPNATHDESFSNPGLLEQPQYTRPETYNNMSVPNQLLSGNHAKIEAWKKREAVKKTKTRRPDLQK